METVPSCSQCCTNEPGYRALTSQHVPGFSRKMSFPRHNHRQTGTVLTSLWKLLLSYSGPFTCISGAYLKPIFFCLKQTPPPRNPTSFSIFPFSVKSLTIFSCYLCLKAGEGEGASISVGQSVPFHSFLSCPISSTRS